MGLSDFPTRLTWGPHGGHVAHDGFRMDLRKLPGIAGLHDATEIDYVRGVVADVRIGCDARRDLSAQEQAAIRTWLDTVAAVVRAAVESVVVAVQR